MRALSSPSTSPTTRRWRPSTCTIPPTDCGSTATSSPRAKAASAPTVGTCTTWRFRSAPSSRRGPTRAGNGDVIANPYVLAWDYGLNPSEVFPIDLPTGNPGTPSPCVSPEGGHWVKDGVGWWYVCAGGKQYLTGGWYTINGRDYMFGPSGYMATGFLKRTNGDWSMRTRMEPS